MSDLQLLKDKEGHEVIFLVIDDDFVDRKMMKRSFRKLNLANQIIEAEDGVEGLECLRGEAGKDKTPQPYIIFLDINMPRMNAAEFLTEVRKDDVLKEAIVVVVTTSNSSVDIDEMNSFGVRSYILKSSLEKELLPALKMPEFVWPSA
jgi:CheY-like chemotaxis protein